jgi:hypothetical protein
VYFFIVMPAEAGIQGYTWLWTPAFAGVTGQKCELVKLDTMLAFPDYLRVKH